MRLKKMRLVFFGSSKESSEVLNKLLNDDFKVDLVVTQDSKASGRGLRISATPVEKVAKTKNLEVTNGNGLFQEDQIKKLIKRNPDLFVVAAYGKILPKAILKIPRLGTINIHPSMLPLFRGPSPVATAILEGVASTGVTIMLLDEGMDTGPIIKQSDAITLRGDEKCSELSKMLFEIGGNLLIDSIRDFECGVIQTTEQDESLATLTKLIRSSDGEINWNEEAIKIYRLMRAFDEWPGIYTFWEGKRLKISDMEITENTRWVIQPGRVVKKGKNMFIGTGSGPLKILSLQLEGRRTITGNQFLVGYHSIVGSTLPT
ncbi:methionyl-tRNA formyltransferase [Dehalococcoidia bacterium]|nr:methionyl-tRNA formyltransferase [Dehalococcoidia bacterium]